MVDGHPGKKMGSIKYKHIFFSLLVFVVLIILSYREFLNLYRSMLLDDYFLYYHYQDQLIYLLSGDADYKDYLPMSARYLNLILSYILYITVPCVELTNLGSLENKHELFQCSTMSVALLNHLMKYLFIVIFFLYMKNNLKSDTATSIIGVFLSSIFFLYLEPYTMDRLVVTYILLALFFNDKKFILTIILLGSFLVNEKVILLLGPYYFLQFVFIPDQKKENLYKVILLMIASFMYFLMIFLLKKYGGYNFLEVYDQRGFDRILLNFFDKSHLSNSIMPVVFCFVPYIVYLINKKKYNLNFTGYEFLIILPLIFLGYGGGENNIGRYAMHSSPIWLPLLTLQLNGFFLNYKDKIKKN